MNYFQDCATIEEIKKLYRELAFKNHPDLGGDEETMKVINSQYHDALKRGNGQKSTDSDGVEHTYKYQEQTEQAIIDKINELLSLKMEGVEILLIGVWVWITGDTKPHKDKIKALGCKWHGKRGCWYWKNYSGSRYSSKGDLDSLAAKYGVEKFSTPKRKKFA